MTIGEWVIVAAVFATGFALGALWMWHITMRAIEEVEEEQER